MNCSALQCTKSHNYVILVAPCTTPHDMYVVALYTAPHHIAVTCTVQTARTSSSQSAIEPDGLMSYMTMWTRWILRAYRITGSRMGTYSAHLEVAHLRQYWLFGYVIFRNHAKVTDTRKQKRRNVGGSHSYMYVVTCNEMVVTCNEPIVTCNEPIVTCKEKVVTCICRHVHRSTRATSRS